VGVRHETWSGGSARGEKTTESSWTIGQRVNLAWRKGTPFMYRYSQDDLGSWTKCCS